MALETLKNVKEINGFNIGRGNDPHDSEFIRINDEWNSITFKLQNQPIQECGVNGCQVDELIEAAKLILNGLNTKFPCRQNSLAITKLEEALHWLSDRRNDREKRGVEGQNKI